MNWTHMSTDHELGLVDTAAALAAGELRSRELVATALTRIAQTQSSLNAFRTVRVEQALREADLADARLAAGERLPLLGVPIAIKDDMDIAGSPTRHGCAGPFPDKSSDGMATHRLRAAGAVIVGKTNLPEFGQWPFTEGTFGRTRNPWHLGHTTGGSSGGSAAAVAAGIVPAALGSDGAGSIRIPAAWTHLVGLKPQRGRVSTWPEPEAFYGLTCFGPLARSVEDAALLLDVATGNHRADMHQPPALSEPMLAVARRRDVGPLRIGLSTRIPFVGFRVALDRQVAEAVERLAAVAEGLGHIVERVDPPYRLIGAGFLPRSLHGLHECGKHVPDPALLDARTRANMRAGGPLGGPLITAAKYSERLAQGRFRNLFRTIDVLLTPTTATPAPEIGAFDALSNKETDRAMIEAAPFAWPWNVLGWPAINIPAGLTHDGLPLGAQLLGASGAEPTLIGLAAQLQDVERWHIRRPTATTAS
ncbi:amidase [Nocardia nova]